MATLPLNIICDVTVITASPQVAAPTFNMGLVVGNSGVIPSYGANSRIRQYLSSTFSAQMLTDGFSADDPEYISMQMYFSQSPPPQAGFVGCQDPTAIFTAIPHSGDAGTGYVVGDIIHVTQSMASQGQLRVATIGGSGAVTALTTVFGQQGTGYSVAASLGTTGGTGTGLEVDITAIGESCLQAIQYCRVANSQWYPGMVTTAVDADHIAISAWVLSQVGTIYLGTTADAAVQNGTPGNVLITLYAASSKRTWMQYATTQGDLFPNQAYFVAAVMGQMMASNTQLANSAYTEKFSGGVPLLAVVVEPIPPSIPLVTNVEGATPSQGPNGNLFLSYGNAFSILEQGTMMAQGVFFDQILNLDVLAANIQFNILNLLTSVPKVPQTDAGQQTLIQAVENALAQAANTGFISSGTWEGQNLLNLLTTGTTLPSGYFVGSQSYAVWGKANPALLAARQAPPIYVALIEAGAVHFVTIEVIVQV